MAEYICSVCNKKFDEEEKSLTNDKNKCILHCDKKTTHVDVLVSEKFEEELKRVYAFPINKFENIIFPKIADDFLDDFFDKSFDNCIFYNNVKINKNFNEAQVLFTKCEFHMGIYLFELNIKNFIFKNCKFYEGSWLRCENSAFLNKTIFEKNINELKGNWNYPNNLGFKDCKFDVKLSLCNLSKLNFIKIEECKFNNDLEIIKCSNLNNLYILVNTFNDNLCINGNIIKNFHFSMCGITKLGVLINNTIVNNHINGNTFKDTVTFQNTIFKSKLDLLNVRFFSNVIFQDMVIEDSLDLKNTIFYDKSNFLDISKKKRDQDENERFIGSTTQIDVENRETARKIKDSFEQQNNIIEANKYYALEMDKRKEELEVDKKKNWFEWLVFKTHEISSNHSQDALLALFWIINIGFIASLFDHLTKIDDCGNLITFSISYFIGPIVVILGIIGIRNIVKDIFRKTASLFMIASLYALYSYTSKDFGLTDFANVINPFSIMTKGESLNLGMLIFKVIIAYLMYQFVVSVRQNTRRK